MVKFDYSLRTSLIVGFMAVMLPIVIFMLINHLYARDSVREKVAETYQNTLDIFVRQADANIEEAENYLLNLSVIDFDVGLLRSLPVESDYYMLAKLRITNKLVRDVGVYSSIDTIFLYQKADVIFASDGEYESIKKMISKHMTERIKEQDNFHNEPQQWIVQYDEQMPGHYFFMITREISEGLYAGAFIRVDDIARQLDKQWSDGEIGYSGIYLRDGNKLGTPLTNDEPPVRWDQASFGEPYRSISNKETGNSYLVLNNPSRKGNIAFQVIVPEKTLLRDLMFFQNVALFAPLGFIVILSLFLVFMRRMLFKPLHELILGMKKISLGMLDVRLNTGRTIEFIFLANTFNKMAEQIKTLKIDVYEEQIRVKQGELRQLQAQINPHFYMNSLNIIYNLAALNDTDSVKKMSLHLADYFRFIMRANRDTITLKEELSHIENYITIQQIRFPDKLECVIDVPDMLRNYPIAALTIQPFVENSIIHGFKNRRKMFYIHVKGELAVAGGGAKPSFRITITDNGIGFPEEVLRRLKYNDPLPEDQSASLGIMNVIHRLNLLYEGEAKIAFDNNGESGGASVTLTLPIPEEGGNANV